MFAAFNETKIRRAIIGPVSVIALAGLLGACSKSSMNSTADIDNLTTGTVAQGSIKQTAFARKAWLADPKSLSKGLAYSRQLEALGQKREQLQVLEQLIKVHPTNSKLKVLYGKKLIASGQSAEAVKILKRAEAAGENDWRMYSALGSALDQTGQNTQARQYYAKALRANPGEVKILNNMAMSYMLEGKFAQAEGILRKAYDTPKGRALPRIRQNLALVVGLQGRFNEARQIASRDLPPKEVEANMAYLKRMLGSSNTWAKLKKS